MTICGNRETTKRKWEAKVGQKGWMISCLTPQPTWHCSRHCFYIDLTFFYVSLLTKSNSKLTLTLKQIKIKHKCKSKTKFKAQHITVSKSKSISIMSIKQTKNDKNHSKLVMSSNMTKNGTSSLLESKHTLVMKWFSNIYV